MSELGFARTRYLLIGMMAVAVAFVALFVACGDSDGFGDDDDDDSAMSGGDDFSDDDDSYDDDDSAGDDDVGDDDDDTPPEPEEDVDPGTRPQICDGAVYVANSEADFISRIQAADMKVKTIEVGKNPTVIRADDSCNHVFTLNLGDHSVSMVNVDDNGVKTLAVRPGMNMIHVAPGGAFALAYHQFDGAGGSLGFGEISIVDVANEEVRSLAIGFPPDRVVFTPDQRVILVSETTLALVDLTNGDYETLPTGLDITQGQELKKVAVTAGGDYALILAEASTKLLALDLADMHMTDVELNCYPTDLDVAEAGDRSLLVCKQAGDLIVLDNDDLSIETFNTTETVGSGELSSDGQTALLFTNSEMIEKVHLMDVGAGTLETFLTVKPIIGAALSPTDMGAILLHYGGDGNPIDEFDQYFDSRNAFSIMNFNDGRINPVELPDPPEEVAFGDTGRYAVVPFPDVRKLVLADMQTGLADVLTTPSRPLEVGLISDMGMAFALQDHPLGRLSFYDVQTLEVRTITGFLLNSGIEE